MRNAALLLLAMVSTACAGEATDDEAAPESSEAAILGGSVEPNHPAVGMLQFNSGNFGSGTLVAPQWVLTAAHVGSGYPPKFLYGVPAAGKAPTAANLTVAMTDRVEFHPCWPRAGYKLPADCPSDPTDVALVHLKEPIKGVTPVPIVATPLEWLWGYFSPFEGKTCVAVGFGAFLDAKNKASWGTRRSATSTIKNVGDDELQTVRATGIATSGDSGGPLMCNGRIVGTVRGRAGAASTVSPYDRIEEGYERTDLHRSWLRATMAN